jgi:hypothetical protein
MATSEDPDQPVEPGQPVEPVQPAEPVQSAGQPRATRRLHWSVSGITFVVGFVVGVVAVGLLGLSVGQFGAGPGPGGAAPTSQAPTSGASVPVVAEARVNAACLAIINDAQDSYVVLTGVDQAVTDVDLQALDDIVRRLQPIEARLGRNLQDCRVETDVSAGPTQSATASPAPTPTASQTR